MKLILTLSFLFFALMLGAQSGRNWMSNLPDNTKLSDLSIPGTHDSGASFRNVSNNFNPAQPLANAQSASIRSQLDYGVRFLDIRIGEFTVRRPPLFQAVRRYRVAHGLVRYSLDLQNVINTIKNFLRANPREVVILSLKVENASGDKANRIKSHCRRVLVANRGGNGLNDPNRLINDVNGTTPAIHQLGWARGQIIILDRSGFGANGGKIGINAGGWGDNDEYDIAGSGNYKLRIQDKYSGVNYDTKRQYISDMRGYARQYHGTNSDKLTLNFASMTNNPVPIRIVAGRINPGIESHYNSTSDRERCILITDFIDQDLAEAIWRNNFNSSGTYIKSGAIAQDKIPEEDPSQLLQQGITRGSLDALIVPNPVSGPFTLIIQQVQRACEAQIVIYDMQGKVALSKQTHLTVGENNLRLEESTFSTGLFILTIATEYGEQKTIQFSHE